MNDTKETVAFGLSAVALGLLAVVVVIAIIVGGWALGGWFQVQNQKRQTTLLRIQNQQNQVSAGNQSGLREDLSTKIQQVAGLTAQISVMGAAERPVWETDRLQIVQGICEDAAGLNSGTVLVPSEFNFIKQHCSSGAAIPAAPFPLQ